MTRNETVDLLGITRGKFVGDLKESFPLAVGKLGAAAALLLPAFEEELEVSRFEVGELSVRRGPILDAVLQRFFLFGAPLAKSLTFELLVPYIVGLVAVTSSDNIPDPEGANSLPEDFCFFEGLDEPAPPSVTVTKPSLRFSPRIRAWSPASPSARLPRGAEVI